MLVIYDQCYHVGQWNECRPLSDIVIVQHPVAVCVPVNYKVTLRVRAEGKGILKYQWFKSDVEEVCSG